ncbi:MAG: hypothetical protein IPG98_11470 [Burkholderiales bacterium]|nr:hypothetical protein [Burkholderiales bacterium]MBK8664860.1 hypothetical protein [Burkholderiales bacterium]
MDTKAHSNEPQPFDLHDQYSTDAKCGYASDVKTAARMMRGIKACAAVLATERPETLELGDYIRSGLISAIDELAFAVICELDDLSKTVKALKPQSER